MSSLSLTQRSKSFGPRLGYMFSESPGTFVATEMHQVFWSPGSSTMFWKMRIWMKYDEHGNMMKYDEIWWYRIWMFQNFRSEFWMSHFSPPRPLSALQSWRSSSWSRRTHPYWNDQVFSISGLIAEIWNKMSSTQSQSYCLMFRGFRGTNRMAHFGYRWWFMDVTIVVRFPSNWLMIPDPWLHGTHSDVAMTWQWHGNDMVGFFDSWSHVWNLTIHEREKTSSKRSDIPIIPFMDNPWYPLVN